MPYLDSLIMSRRLLKVGLEIPQEFSNKIEDFSTELDTEGCSSEYIKDFITRDFVSLVGKKIVYDTRGTGSEVDLYNQLEFYYPDVYEMFFSSTGNPEKSETLTSSYIDAITDFASWACELPEVKTVKENIVKKFPIGDIEYLDVDLNNTLVTDTNTAFAVFEITKHEHL